MHYAWIAPELCVLAWVSLSLAPGKLGQLVGVPPIQTVWNTPLFVAQRFDYFADVYFAFSAQERGHSRLDSNCIAPVPLVRHLIHLEIVSSSSYEVSFEGRFLGHSATLKLFAFMKHPSSDLVEKLTMSVGMIIPLQRSLAVLVIACYCCFPLSWSWGGVHASRQFLPLLGFSQEAYLLSMETLAALMRSDQRSATSWQHLWPYDLFDVNLHRCILLPKPFVGNFPFVIEAVQRISASSGVAI